jgi:hypothetical protein
MCADPVEGRRLIPPISGINETQNFYSSLGDCTAVGHTGLWHNLPSQMASSTESADGKGHVSRRKAGFVVLEDNDGGSMNGFTTNGLRPYRDFEPKHGDLHPIVRILIHDFYGRRLEMR